jgi:precorrin-2 dehydrogenase / sirohydrochlorin ferrochelatase
MSNLPDNDVRVGDSPRVSRYLPLAIDMTGLRCLVVGGGRVGTRKALRLAHAGGKVSVLSPDVSPDIAQAAEQGRMDWRQAEYDATHLDGFALIVAATSDAELNGRIGREAQARGALCCNASDAASSQVIFPAVGSSGQVTVAVHTDGRDCRLAQRVRDRIQDHLNQWFTEDE